MPGRLKLWIVLAVACLWPAQALATIPPGNTTDPLQRSALLSLGSIYRVETTVSVDALRTDNGTGRIYPLGRIHDVTLLGTAFAVAPTGVLVTAAHVAAPFGPSLAVAAAPLALAQVNTFGDQAAYENWVSQNNVVPVGAKVRALRVWRATAGAVTAPPVPAHLIPDSAEAIPDLALIQLADHNVPALTFNEGETIATPIVSIGYGTGTPTTLGLPDTLVPSVKTGQLGATGKTVAARGQTNPAPDQLLTFISAPITHGDSGAPAVDGYPTAQVHGVVRFPYGGGGLIEPSQAVFDLLQREHIAAPTSGGPVYDTFATGMKDMWSGDYVGAEGAFTRTLTADRTHPLAAQELRLAAQLAHAKPTGGRPAWWRVLFVGIAIAAAAAALLCGWRLRRLGRLRDGHDDAAAQAPPAQ